MYEISEINIFFILHFKIWIKSKTEEVIKNAISYNQYLRYSLLSKNILNLTLCLLNGYSPVCIYTFFEEMIKFSKIILLWYFAAQL